MLQESLPEELQQQKRVQPHAQLIANQHDQIAEVREEEIIILQSDSPANDQEEDWETGSGICEADEEVNYYADGEEIVRHQESVEEKKEAALKFLHRNNVSLHCDPPSSK